jgi:hypothetical protein
MAKAQKYAFNYGKKFTDVVAKGLAKAGNK